MATASLSAPLASTLTPTPGLTPDQQQMLARVARNGFSSPAVREHWKYSKIDGAFELLERSDNNDVELPEIDGIDQPGVALEILDPAANLGDWVRLETGACPTQHCPMASAVLLRAEKIFELRVTQSTDTPLTIDKLPTGTLLAVTVRADVSTTLIDRVHNPCNWIAVRCEPNARLSYARARTSVDPEWSRLEFRLAQNAQLRLAQTLLAAEFRRQDLGITLAGVDARAEVYGAWMGEGRQHFDQQAHVHHQARQSFSQQTYRTIGMDRAKLSMRGRIWIDEGCPGVDAALSHKNLSLDPNVQINTKPELEIYTDEVRCAHGATVGQLDEQALFYLRSRGIDEAQARTLLACSFLAGGLGGDLVQESQGLFSDKLQARGQ